MTSRQQESRPGAAPGGRPWSDTSRPREERISLLLAEMTLEEKAAQLGSAWPKSNLRDASEAPRQDVFTREGSYEQARKDGVGHFTRPFGSQPQEPLQAARELAELQQDLLHGTRLGIPAIAHDECLTGFTAYRASAFPGPLAWAATFDRISWPKWRQLSAGGCVTAGYIRGWRRCWTSCEITDGGGWKKPWVRNPIWLA